MSFGGALRLMDRVVRPYGLCDACSDASINTTNKWGGGCQSQHHSGDASRPLADGFQLMAPEFCA